MAKAKKSPKKSGQTKKSATRSLSKSVGVAPLVWAIDPFSDLKDFYPRASALLRFMAEKDKSVIQPTYVLSPDGLNWTGEFTGPWMKRYEPLVQAAFAKLAPELKLGEGASLEVLGNKDQSLRLDAKKLTDFARGKKAKMLVLHTHARKGMNRVLMGSFAETALLLSSTPVLLLNPDTAPPSSVRKILFPTDLSSASKRAFKDVMAHAKSWGAELILFHKLPDPIEPVIQSGVYMAGGGWVSLYQFMEREGDKRRKVCEEWAALAHKGGVKTTVVIEDQPGFVADSIVKHGRSMSVDMIAMSSQAGRVSAVLLGSVARDVARQAEQPILVYRS